MDGYLILVGVLAAGLVGVLRSSGVRFRLLGGVAALVLALQLVAFTGYGMLVGETGPRAKMAGRDTLFEAKNGVRMLVSKPEQAMYSDLAETIAANSGSNDPIVCVPYCAGFAFMADRNMLFREHYVDDSTPAIFPGWIESAIALTERQRPPVIIVLDWAINGSEESRFDHWASRYLQFVRDTYPVSGRFGLGTVWVRRMDDGGAKRSVDITDYGPRSVQLGQIFNRQPNGQSALWLRTSAPVGTGVRIRLDGHDLETSSDGTYVMALVPADTVARPGRHDLDVVNPLRNLASPAVSFDVIPP